MTQSNAPKRLDKSILRSYSSLRWTLVVVGIVFPFLLLIGGKVGIYRAWGLQTPDFPSGFDWKDSLSAYYHAGFKCNAHRGALRDIFVGSLWTISFCLIIYTGFSKLENWLLNLAGFALLCVAFFPTDWPSPSDIGSCKDFEPFIWRPFGLPHWLSVHTISAIVFYILIILVTTCTAMETVKVLPVLPSERNKTKRFYSSLYNGVKWIPIGTRYLWIPGIRWIMIFYAPIAVGLLCVHDPQRFVLWAELVGNISFGIYWLCKSIEMMHTKLDVALIETRRGLSSINTEYMGDKGRLTPIKE